MPHALVHLMGRSSPFSGAELIAPTTSGGPPTVVRSPKSGRSLLSLGSFEVDRRVAFERTARALAEALPRIRRQPPPPPPPPPPYLPAAAAAAAPIAVNGAEYESSWVEFGAML